MGMMRCLDCFKEMSDRAAQCPHCGAPAPTGKQKQFSEILNQVFYLIAVVVAVVALVLGWPLVEQISAFITGIITK